MPLLVDDLLELPFQLFGTIFNVIVQTSYKSAWANYKRELNIALLRMRRDFEEGRLTREEMKEIESHIFKEMRVANRMLGPRV